MVTGYVPHPEIGRDLVNFELVYFQEATHFWNFNGAHTEKLFYSIQVQESLLGCFSLFSYLYIIKFYTFHYHILKNTDI